MLVVRRDDDGGDDDGDGGGGGGGGAPPPRGSPARSQSFFGTLAGAFSPRAGQAGQRALGRRGRCGGVAET